MKRFLPRTLISQMILILLAGLVASHLIVAWIYTSDRAHIVRVIGGYVAAERIANLARLVDEAPLEWRDRIITAMVDPRLRVSITPRPPQAVLDPTAEVDVPIRAYLLDHLPEKLTRDLRVLVTAPPPPNEEAKPRPGMRMRPRGPGVWGPGVGGPWSRLRVSIRLSDGQWLNFAMGLPDDGPPTPWRLPTAMLLMSGIVVAASVWAVRRVTRPLGVVTRAAERLGRDVNAPPIVEAGSLEMRQAAHAFNDMQDRLQRLLRNRTTMLAALSHDLRTPLTLLRLRIENLPESEERERMLGSVATLDSMIAGTLAYARDTTAPEVWRRVDVASLLDSIADDMADAGRDVTMAEVQPVILECQPNGLRRAVTNLVDNAVKYGERARLSLMVTDATVSIVVDDDGPGIPRAELSRVCDPFYRLEQSRSRETGGSGLGLAIAQAIAEAHDGRLDLINRAGGGLRAMLELPRARG